MKYFYILFICLSANILASQERMHSTKLAKIDSFIEHLTAHNQLIGSVSIYEKGREVYSSHFGQEALDDSVTDKEKLRYQIGSITKLVTATLVQMRIEEGRLDLDTKLSAYFPSVPNSEHITIRHMLTHTSGLKDYVIKNDSMYYWLMEPVEQSAILDEIVRQGVAFPVDSTTQYSNSAFYLLGRILEKEHGKTYKEIVQERIAQPLSLSSITALYGEDSEATLPIASSYRRENNVWKAVDEFYFRNASAAGDITTTMRDLNAYINALFRGDIIDTAYVQRMLPSGDSEFGQGMMLVPFYDHKFYGHAGATFGTQSLCAYNPTDEISIAYSINGEVYPHNDFAIGVLSLVYDMPFEFPDFTIYHADTSVYTSYEGMYRTEKLPIGIKVYVKEGKLIAQGDGQPAFELTPKDKDVFEFQEAQIQMEFKPSENIVVLKQSGIEFELKRE